MEELHVGSGSELLEPKNQRTEDAEYQQLIVPDRIRIQADLVQLASHGRGW